MNVTKEQAQKYGEACRVEGGDGWQMMADFATDSVKAVKREIAQDIEDYSYLAETDKVSAWIDSLTKRLREEAK